MKRVQFILVFLMMALTLQAEPKKLDPFTAKIKNYEIKELTLPEAIVALNKQIRTEYPDHKHLLVGFVDKLADPIVDVELAKALGVDANKLVNGKLEPKKRSLSFTKPMPIEVVVKYLCDGYFAHYGKFDQTLIIYGWHLGDRVAPEDR